MTERINVTGLPEDLLAKLKKWDAAGMPRREMADKSGVSSWRLNRILGKRPRKILAGEPRIAINVWTYREAFRKATAVARSLGYITTAGNTAGSGNVGRMLEGIASGELVVMKREDVTEPPEAKAIGNW